MERPEIDQTRAPIYEALERFREMRVVPFDVPGHKHGKGNPELTAFLGEKGQAEGSSSRPFPLRPTILKRAAGSLQRGASHYQIPCQQGNRGGGE